MNNFLTVSVHHLLAIFDDCLMIGDQNVQMGEPWLDSGHPFPPTSPHRTT